ncbi:hypothetical protein KXV68_000815 [Aspergillus fumigatus]|nr:hypothetical protein KXX67_004087 [Aspergillus fumigatus]KAH2148571.1 hypothetical protein KXV68_000815 [Aspergillus fumigatus]KAH2351687.1 hypothetical protein KXW91_001358 [Aspergillus fumigatus]KAH2835065.1 hypothetical protein KXW76_002967 [Aspergillus fumigatus]KAH3301557.1 hypothetical protein KXW74_003297 [Aspergillus fumigatus]
MAPQRYSVLRDEKCLFPVRNDGKLLVDEWRVTELAISSGEKGLKLCRTTCPTAGADPRYLAAAAWALLLWRFAEVDTVQIGLQDIPPGANEDILEAGLKRGMKVLAASRRQVQLLNELWQGDTWSISDADPTCYSYFDTGIVICRGNSQDCLAKCRSPNQLRKANGEACNVLLVLELDLDSNWRKCFLAYKTTVLTDIQATHLKSSFEEVVELARAGRGIFLSEICLVSRRQLDQIGKWNERALVQPKFKAMHQVVHDRATDRRHHPAVIAADRALSYSELETLSLKVAYRLRGSGVQPGDLIPVCFCKSSWAIVAMLAINKLGAAFVPLDPSQPVNRLKSITRQLDATLAVTSPENQSLVEDLVTTTVVVSETTVSELVDVHNEIVLPACDPGAPAYCLFTSGSTGKPKGCVVDHAALASVATHSHALHLGPTSRVLQFASFTFGVSLIEVWCTLAAGGTVCLPSDSDRVSRLADAIRSMGVDWCILTPTVLATLEPEAVPNLRTILVAGEPLKKAQFSLWAERARLFQAYGFTEWAGICCVSPQIRSIGDVGIIGTPANARCWLVEPGNPNQLAPIGAVAELAVEGPSLAQGYLHDPEKTAATLIPPPRWRAQYGHADGKRIYTTGDLVYYDSNGMLRYVSRKDRQVKIRGQRIDLAEPEYHIAQACCTIRNVVLDAIVPADSNGDAILVAFVLPSRDESSSNGGHDSPLFAVPDDHFTSSVRQLTSFLEDKLPDYMVPRLFLQLKETPVTITGKIARQKLREAAEALRHDELVALAGLETRVLPPNTHKETLIHQLVVELLHLPPEMVGMNHNFFSLGGDSVSVMKLVSRAKRVGLSFTVKDVFRSPQLGDLARLTDVVNSGAAQHMPPFSLLDRGAQPGLLSMAAKICQVESSMIQDIYPCTPLQEGMMTLSAAKAGSYIARFVYRLEEHVDSPRFRRAWEMTVEATPILRTRIISASDGRLYQVVIQEKFRWDDDGQPSGECVQNGQDRHMLLGEPLTHAALVRDRNQDGSLSTVFVLTMHHSVCDRWSVGLIMDSVETAYTGQTLTTNSMGPFLQYIQQLQGGDAFWRSQFVGVKAEVFPSLPSPEYTPTPTETIDLSVELRDAVLGGHTIANAIRLAWALVISHYTSCSDVVFGVTISGRAVPVPDIERIIGPIIATVPLRVRLKESSTVLEALKAIQDQSMEMIPFEQLGLRQIRKLSPEAEEACNFQSQLVVQPAWGDENRSLFATCEAGAAAEGGFAAYALSMICQLVGSSQIDVRTEFDPKVIQAPIMQRIVHHFVYTLQYLLAHPDARVAEIPVVSPGEKQLLRQWNGIVPPASHQCVHEIIQQRQIERPTSTAVWAWDGQLTYAELGELSDRLAEYLATKGVQPEVIVPVCLEKSYWTTVAMLGISKAGGAFALLDPSQPEQRLQSICHQLNSAVILTSEKNRDLAGKLASHPIVLSLQSSRRWGHGPAKQAPATARPDHTLYVAFTSGSTGTPKGVVIEHRSFCTSALALNRITGVNSESRMLQFAGYSFDGSIMEMLSALMAGACVCVPSEFQRRNELVAAAAKFELTHAHLTPSVARHLLRGNPEFTKTLVSVGEPMTASDVADWASNGQCKVMNGYGPAECAVSTTIQAAVTSASDPKNIGFPVAGVCWVVHPENHDILLPPGAVGELLIEGPTLARGYLNEPDKTAAAFIPLPAWIKDIRPEQPHGRLYKSGDLVRYNADGSFQYIGRRDSQIKLRGQRIELDEVEKHVYQCWPGVIAVVAVEMVSFTPATQTLVAFVVVEEHVDTTGDILAAPTQEFTGQVAVAQARLREAIPAFMVPEIFIPLLVLPQSASGKTDRRRLRSIATACTREKLAAYGAVGTGTKREPTSVAEREMQAIWAQALNLPLAEIGMDDSFYQLGGDSITAMQVVAHARSKGLAVTMDSILRLKSISKIMSHESSLSPAIVHIDEEEDVWFALSPIQQMFFDRQPSGWDRFSQVFLLRVSQPVTASQLQMALHTLVSKHPMLRARFAKQHDGSWRQVITSKIQESYRCRSHRLNRRSSVDGVVSSGACSLSIQKGPLIAVDLMSREDGAQYLSIVIHHLVVDLVSWRIILADLEAMLRGENPMANHSTPFQTWCRLQAEYARQYLSPQHAFPTDLPDHYHQDPSVFWGLAGQPNLVRDSRRQVFTLDEHTTRQLLGAANAAFATRTDEVLHAVLLYSFLKVFPHRIAPLTFSEGHGREPWDSAIDLSQTVGWFTTMWPVVAELQQNYSFLEVVCRVKDARRAVPCNGWAYFVSRYLNPSGRQAFQQFHPVELVFNYAGEYQQFNQAGAFFIPDMPEYQGSLDAGEQIQRFGIFEVFASVVRGCLQFQFMYNRYMKHQLEIQKWIESCRQTLIEGCSTLIAAKPSRTLSDFPLLPLTYSTLRELLDVTLPTAGVSVENVEDIYPCSPSQRGMLIAQAKAAHNYNASVTWSIRSRIDSRPNVARLKAAWCEVVKRHAILRTVFVESPWPESYMDQVVLQTVSPEFVFSRGSDSLPQSISSPGQTRWSKGQCQHIMRVWERDNGDILCRLDLSHAIMDRTTLAIIQKDLSLAYDERLLPGRAPLYRDYVSYIYQQDSESARQYWQGYLEGVEPCEFPTLNPVDPSITNEWGNLYRTLEDRRRLEEFCRTHSVTPWNVAGLAWAMVLRSFTRTDSVCFGYVKSGRDLPIDGIAGTAGPVFNPLPCRVHLTERLTVRETIGRLQEEYLQSLAHQSFPLSDIHRLAGVTSGVLFNTSVAVQTEVASEAEEAKRSLEFTTVAMEDGTEDDMVITLVPRGGELVLHLRHRSRTLTTDQASTVLATFEKALCSILANAEAPMTSIDVFSDHDKAILWSRNRRVPDAVESCVHELIQKHCVERPHSPAVNAWDGAFTYGQLDELSSRLAVYLAAQGVGPNVVVPLCFEKTRWTPIAMMGVMKAGGAFLLLDPSYPLQRLKDICADIDCRLVVSSTTHEAMSRELASTVVVVGEDRHHWQLENTSHTITMPKVRPADALYVVFTSGSTGKPKGVVIEHRSYCSGALDHIRSYNLTPQSRVLQFSSYAFDISIVEQLSVLIAGGCICVISESQRKNSLGEAATALQANHAMLIPSVARLVRHEDLSTITSLSLAGECMQETDVSYWAQHVRLMNGYGPAECSALSLVQPCVLPHSDPHDIGYPVGSVAWVVDPHDHHKLVPNGAVGELLIEGPIVGRGYINNAEKTAEVFIEPPTWLRTLRGHCTSRLYKTGDLVRANPSGSLSILGRKDRQVKLRGQRLELGEVEANVQHCFPGALDVVADLLPSSRGGKPQLVAMVFQNAERAARIAPESDSKLIAEPSVDFMQSATTAETRLRQTVPNFMVPSMFLPLAQIPRTHSDKVDRNSLLKAVAAMSSIELQAYKASVDAGHCSTRAPSTEEEKKLAEIWADVLKVPVEHIGADDNFLLSGGDSIDAMKAAAFCRAAGMALSVADIFAHPVLSDLAKVAVPKSLNGSSTSHQPFSLSPVDSPKDLHMSLMEQGLVPPGSALADLLPGTQAQQFFIERGTFHSYNFSIRGPLDRCRLQKTCTAILSRHSILRTKFLQYEGRLIQIVLDNLETPFTHYTTDGDLLEFCKSLWERDLAALDGLGRLPCKFTLVSRSEQEHVFTIQISHAQWDGVSIPRLFSDIAAIYNQIPLPSTTHFADYVYHRSSRDERPAFDFWKKYLRGSSMPVPFPATNCQDREHKTQWTFQGIKNPRLPAGITMASLVKAACGFHLCQLLSQNDVVFGHTVNGRNLALDNVEALLGCCLNFIPLRVMLQPSWTVLDLLAHVQEQYTRALPHEHLELRDIFRHSTPWPADTQLSFIVQHQNIELHHNIALDGLQVQYSKFAQFDPLTEVWIFSEPHPDRLEIQVCANTRVLSEDQARALCRRLCDLIEFFSASPDCPLSKVVDHMDRPGLLAEEKVLN